MFTFSPPTSRASAMPVLSELLLLAAYASPPDLQIQVLAKDALSGRVQDGTPDGIYWVEQDTGRLFVTEMVDGQLASRLVTSNVSSVTALVDYDGDGQANLIGSVGESVKYDLESGQPVGLVALCGEAVAGDTTGDGFGDFASSSSLWVGQAGGFREGAAFAGETTETCRSVYALGDLDADGRMDLARADLHEPDDYFGYGALEGTLQLYLGCEYSEPLWTPHWSYDHPTPDYGPGLGVTTVDGDGDGVSELLVLSGQTDAVGYSVWGELQLLDNVLDPLGPTVVASREVDSDYLGTLVSLQGVGDLDGDGDDEVLVQGRDFLGDNLLVRFIDAEPTPDGLLQVVGPSFDLPVPVERFQDNNYFRALLGDYDGDGWRDVALVMRWLEEDGTLGGTISVWLGLSPIQTAPALGDLSHCQPPEEDTGSTDDPEEPPTEGTACLGCATTRPSGLLLLLALPWLTRRRGKGVC
jgi:hypothetical protein